MQSLLPETSPHKAGRRVLGEKTANASLTPATKRIADAASQKFPTTAIPFNASGNTLQTKPRGISPEARHAGQKRTIDQVVEGINEAESEPRKVFMSSQSESEQAFEIFHDGTSTRSSQREAPSTASTAPEIIERTAESLKDYASRVPTEPAARKIFIQQRAALAKSRLQSAMRRVENKSLDLALSQFEANSRPFLRRIPSSSSTLNTQRGQQQASEKISPTKQKRVLLPPLPLQPRSRPVRSSAQKTAPSPSSEYTRKVNPSRNDDDEEEGEDIDDEEEDNDKTPKAQSAVRQQDTAADSDGIEVPLSQESDSVMDKLVKWTQSSADSSRTVEA